MNFSLKSIAPAVAGLSAIFTAGCADQYGRPNPAGYAATGGGIGAIGGLIVGAIEQQNYDNNRYNRYNTSYNNNYNYGYQQPGYAYPQQPPRYQRPYQKPRVCVDRRTGYQFSCLMNDGRVLTIEQEVDETFPQSRAPQPDFFGG